VVWPAYGDWIIDTQELSTQFLGEAKLQEALDAAGIINFRPHSALSDAMSTVKLLQWQQHLLRQIHLPRVSMLPTTTSLLPPIPLLLFRRWLRCQPAAGIGRLCSKRFGREIQAAQPWYGLD